MPTIDQLAPATSASDSDEFMVSQGGVTRKVTRTQVLNGVQPLLAVTAGTLLGRSSTGVGSPEVITIGQNLLLQQGTLGASVSGFSIGGLPNGTVPSAADLVPIEQGGTAVAVTFAEIVSGVSSAVNLDVSQATVTATGTETAMRMADFAATTLTKMGGTLSGALVLCGNPSAPAQAANKSYVDQTVAGFLPSSGGTLTGILTLAGQPVNLLDAATKSYVDISVVSAVPLSGGSMSGSLALSGDPTTALSAATKQYVDQRIWRSGDTLTGALVLSMDPVTPQQAATKNYVDGLIATVVPKAGGTLSGSLMLASEPTLSAQASTKQYVDQRVLRNGDTLTGMLVLASDPTAAGQAATKNYVDTRVVTTIARLGDTMSGSLTLSGDPATALQAATKQYADLKVARTGDSLIGVLYLAGDPTLPLQASTKRYVDAAFSDSLTTAGGTLTGPLILVSDPSVAMQASTKEYVDARVLRSGDTLSGALLLAADPIVASQAATKNYVDTQILSRLPLSGGSLTGSLALSLDPVLPIQAATKRYVDNQIAGSVATAGGTVVGPLVLSTAPSIPQSAATKQYVDTQVATALPMAGGTLTGLLTLAAAPVLPMHAASKAYVDQNPGEERVINVTMAPFGAKIDGVTDDTLAFKTAYQAAPAGSAIYVPNGTVVLQSTGAWGISLTKSVKWIVDGTVLTDGTPLGTAVPGGSGPSRVTLPGVVIGNSLASLTTSQGISSSTDFAVNQSAYLVTHTGGTAGSVSANNRTDTIIYASPGNYIWGGLDRLIWAGSQTPTASTPAQHVGRYVQTIRQSAATGTGGTVLPQPDLWAACLEFRDATGLSSASTTAASLTIEMDWFGNGTDDANCRSIQSLVVGQVSKSGAPVEINTVISAVLDSASTGSVKTVLFAATPFSNAVLDTTHASSINSAPAIKLAAGQAVSFDSGNENRLYFDAATNAVRLAQGDLSFVVGRGITVGFENVFAATGTIPSYVAGNIIFLEGTGSYTLTLPQAVTVSAGTGFTFSNIGSASVGISPNGSDVVDSAPIVMHPNDRYHIVSDGISSWREIFRTNAVSPSFSAPITLASYIVGNLPAGLDAGAKAFASNGRKPTEAHGAGTGVEVFFDGTAWISSCSGTQVAV
jgi:hypothetical protein